MHAAAVASPAALDTPSRRRVPWLESEVDALRHGVELHGTGAWALILAGGGFHPKRSGVDLKDKWRNLTATHSPHPLAPSAGGALAGYAG